MKVENLTKLQAKIQALKKQIDDKPSVVVGYSQSYAVYVHEDLNARHAEGKQAKYLEAPARRFQADIALIVRNVTKKTMSLTKGLLAGGLRLLRESQAIVPIDTAALKASGYVALESESDAVATAARARSDGIRRSAVKRSVARADKKHVASRNRRTRNEADREARRRARAKKK